ncbi:Gfo/Idh/MocA family protein [Caldivirga maquilingensis]|uniref:Oxidoreductase domain protein n=1 Tax=Caldivirga maquilingensis (strain ATCC 700844 / DSM 13496 / JCM 10307 / IC-167) TaxID=397948 RepID=A8M9A0_CALMQ|nr:Gfo/Idh/MocA family oxidoreductase [Caldivirga maquilingensis]ABW02319.1 oxidoreductase domain protein [Caldivirga maquilingensis IC-167]
MGSQSKVRLGFIGAGRRGRELMAAAKNAGAELVSAVDVSEDALREVSGRFGIRVYRDVDEMLSKERLNAVVVSTPVRLHVNHVVKALDHGLDVLVEKPVTLSVNEANELLRRVKASGGIVVVGFQNRYSEAVRGVGGIINDCRESMFAGYWYWTIPPIPWFRRRSETGGQIVEQVIHVIDLARYFMGDVKSIYAAYTEAGRDTGEDKALGFENWASYSLTMVFKNGTVGSIHSTYALYPELGREVPLVGFDVICREELIRFTGFNEARVYRRGGETLTFKSSTDSTVNMFKAFIQAIQTRDKGIVPTIYEDAYWSNVTALAANESALTGRVINIDDYASLGVNS